MVIQLLTRSLQFVNDPPVSGAVAHHDEERHYGNAGLICGFVGWIVYRRPTGGLNGEGAASVCRGVVREDQLLPCCGCRRQGKRPLIRSKIEGALRRRKRFAVRGRTSEGKISSGSCAVGEVDGDGWRAGGIADGEGAGSGGGGVEDRGDGDGGDCACARRACWTLRTDVALRALSAC